MASDLAHGLSWEEVLSGGRSAVLDSQAVAAIYGTVTYLTNSILPAVVLHTGGNSYSNADLWLHGQAQWHRGVDRQGGDGDRVLVHIEAEGR